MAANNQAAHTAAITSAGAALFSAINAAKDDGLKVDLALRVLVFPGDSDVQPATSGRFELSEIWYNLNGPTS